MIPDGLSYPSLLCLLLAPIIYYLHRRKIAHRYLDPFMPWAGVEGDEWFGRLGAHMREWKNGRKFLDEGYRKYNKQNLSFATPNTTWKPEVLLPPSAIQWLLHQPKSVLNVDPVRNILLAFHYTISPLVYNNRAIHNSVLLKDLTRHMGLFAQDAWEEFGAGLVKEWDGPPKPRKTKKSKKGEKEMPKEEAEQLEKEGWREVNIYEGVQEAALRGGNRVFFGPSLSNNRTYMDCVLKWSHLLAVTGALSRFIIPELLLPLFGPIVALPCNFYSWRCSRILFPEIRKQTERIMQQQRRDTKSTSGDRDVGTDSEQDKENLIDWLIRSALASGNPAELDPHILYQRSLLLNFAAIHTLSFTLTNLLFDLASASSNYLVELRQEAEAVYIANNKTWTRAAVASLHRHDSCIKETLRYWGFGGRGMMHEVMAPEGVVLPDGQHLLKGAWVGVPTERVMHDEDTYERADVWEGFRFFDEREKARKELEARAKEEGRLEDVLRERKLGLVSTSERFLAFGFGRDACPGRFFAAQQMKLVLAYIVMNYDIRSIEKRPENQEISDFTVPPVEEKLWVRRREVWNEDADGIEADRIDV